MRVEKFALVTAGAMPAAATGNFVGAWLPVDQFEHVTVVAAFVGTAAGSLTLEASIDGTTAVQQGAAKAVAGANGNMNWELPNCAYPLIRLKYVPTALDAGTSVLDALASCKRLN